MLKKLIERIQEEIINALENKNHSCRSCGIAYELAIAHKKETNARYNLLIKAYYLAALLIR